VRKLGGRVHGERPAALTVPTADVAGLDTPAELPALVADAALWAKDRR